MNKMRSLILTGAIACIIVTVVVANSSSSKAQQIIPHSSSGSISSMVTGAAAIPIRAVNDPALKVKGARYTSADAIQYVVSHKVAHTLLISTRPTVDTVDFVKSQEASRRLNGETIGIPDSWLVCFVLAHGNFSVTGPDSKTVSFQKVIEVFDAQTGNLLLVSFQS